MTKEYFCNNLDDKKQGVRLNVYECVTTRLICFQKRPAPHLTTLLARRQHWIFAGRSSVGRRRSSAVRSSVSEKLITSEEMTSLDLSTKRLRNHCDAWKSSCMRMQCLLVGSLKGPSTQLSGIIFRLVQSASSPYLVTQREGSPANG